MSRVCICDVALQANAVAVVIITFFIFRFLSVERVCHAVCAFNLAICGPDLLRWHVKVLRKDIRLTPEPLSIQIKRMAL